MPSTCSTSLMLTSGPSCCGNFARDLECHNPILNYSLKFIFFQNKNQKNKIKAGNVEKAGQKIKL